MYINNKLKIDIQDLITTTEINSHLTNTLESFDDNNDMTNILSYAIPLSCLAIITVLLLAFAIHRRHRVLDKWNSLTRMKNTNPRFYECAGLRSNSECEIYSDSCVNVTTINENEQIPKESDFRLATIT
jgi:hypothetical protein